mgnify:CR=1 FL=1
MNPTLLTAILVSPIAPITGRAAILPASIPDRVFDITAHGAVPDGSTSATAAIQQTIDAASKAGGGLVEGLRYRNITMKNVRYPIMITSYYPKLPAGPAQDLASDKSGRTPVWRDISIEDVAITGSQNSIILWGLPDQPIAGVRFKNIKAATQLGARVFHAKDVDFSNVEIVPAAGPALEVFDAAVTGMAGVAPIGNNVKFK